MKIWLVGLDSGASWADKSGDLSPTLDVGNAADAAKSRRASLRKGAWLTGTNECNIRARRLRGNPAGAHYIAEMERFTHRQQAPRAGPLHPSQWAGTLFQDRVSSAAAEKPQQRRVPCERACVFPTDPQREAPRDWALIAAPHDAMPLQMGRITTEGYMADRPPQLE
jgi:hypothetical protein